MNKDRWASRFYRYLIPRLSFPFHLAIIEVLRCGELLLRQDFEGVEREVLALKKPHLVYRALV